MRTKGVPWSVDELRILKALYPEHGFHWTGWESALPARTADAIRAKAYKLRIPEPYPKSRSGRRMPNASEYDTGERDRISWKEDPMERYILWRMSEGMTPSQIDGMKHWPSGRSVLIISERWKRERDREG